MFLVFFPILRQRAFRIFLYFQYSSGFPIFSSSLETYVVDIDCTESLNISADLMGVFLRYIDSSSCCRRTQIRILKEENPPEIRITIEITIGITISIQHRCRTESVVRVSRRTIPKKKKKRKRLSRGWSSELVTDREILNKFRSYWYRGGLLERWERLMSNENWSVRTKMRTSPLIICQMMTDCHLPVDLPLKWYGHTFRG